MKKIIWPVAGVLLIGLIAFLVSRANNLPYVPTPGTVSSSTATYSMAQVGQHNGVNSCWSVIDGKVYDLTNWISQHPGGSQAILSICGIDGSAAFHGQHDHAARQEDILANMFIGSLR